MPTLALVARRLAPVIAALALSLGFAANGTAQTALPSDWPEDSRIQGQRVDFPSANPFTLADVGSAPEEQAVGALFLPPGASADDPVPAVVLLHGAGGVIDNRGPRYGRQLAAMGIAALVVDSFAARRDLAAGFVDRLLEITEVMLVADAYAALRFLDARPEVEAARTALVGFSYGGMASVFAAYEQVAEQLAPAGLRFAGHVAFYAPCIARFERVETTGAPVLMLWGDGDAIVDPERCAEVARDLERGGSAVETISYSGAYHQWDGRRSAPRTIGRNLAPCSYRVDENGTAWDRTILVPLINPFFRKISLGLCSDSAGYMIGRDDAVRARSNADLARFLNRTLGLDRGG